MVAYSQTVRNNCYAFSNAGTNISIWNTEQWGGYWGYEPTKPAYLIGKNMATQTMVVSSTVAKSVGKNLLTQTITANHAVTKSVGKNLATQSVTLTDATIKQPGKNLAAQTMTFGSSLTKDIGKNLPTQTMVATSANGSLAVIKYPTAETIILSDSLSKEYSRTLTAEILTVNGDTYSEEITDAAGFKKLFGNVENAENRTLTQYSSQAVTDVTWVVGSRATTVWS